MLDSEPGQFLFGAFKNITIFMWSAQATGPAVERLARATDPIYTAHPEGVSNIHVIANELSLPTPEARAGFLELMKSRAERRACIATVIAGSGFWASAFRSFITGMRLVSPRSYEMGIHTNMAEAAEWLPLGHLKKTGVSVSRLELNGVLQRAQLLNDQNKRMSLVG